MSAKSYTDKELRDAFDRSKVALLCGKGSVFITTVLFSLKHRWDKNDNPTACTDGVHLWMNPDFFMANNPEQRIGLIAHEAWHVGFDHLGRVNNRNMHKWNIATDHVINLMLTKAGYELPDGAICDSKYADMSAEEIYNALPDKDLPPDPQHFKDNTNNPSNQAQVQNTVSKASTAARMDKSHGDLPGEIQRMIGELENPKVPWYIVLRNYFTAYAKTDYSWKKPNRRFFPDHILPSMHAASMGQISIYIDVSGSVSEEELTAFVTESMFIKEQLNPSELKIALFNTRIVKEYRFTNEQEVEGIEFAGCGGTRINPVIADIKDEQPQVALIFTDGEFSIPDDTPATADDVYWVIYGNDGWSAPFGHTIPYVV